MPTNDSLAQALDLHSSAVAGVVSRAERISESSWHAPIAGGKWSPAEVLAHLIATYDTLLRELGGGPGMAIRTKPWQRWLLRLTVLPGILKGRGFPKGATAPRETRPVATAGRDESLELFRRRADEVDRAARKAGAGQTITHAYFGAASLADGMRLCTRHIEHHASQLLERADNRG